MLTEAELQREAAATGFRTEVLEKVHRLIELLATLTRHPFLGPRVALKGGTALNLFTFEIPRLSVDIDLNYIGSVERETMLAERPKVEQAIQAVCGRLGIQVRRAPAEHAGGKWRLSYGTSAGRSGTLELDVNFLQRTPLWPAEPGNSRSLGMLESIKVPVLDVHELAAGKLAALFGRDASRDLFDSRELLLRGGLERKRLRLGFIVYGGASRRDWREVSIDEVAADPVDVERSLVPMLQRDLAPARAEIPGWTEKMVAECKDGLTAVLPLEASERQFLDALNDRGEIIPSLLTTDSRLQQVIQTHPGLLWKARNVRRHRGVDEAE